MKLFPLIKNIDLQIVVCILLGLCGFQSIAQEYPTKPITLVVGFGPGGNADIVARLLAQKLSIEMNQQILVENKGGAGGMLANDSVAKAPPDGYQSIRVVMRANDPKWTSSMDRSYYFFDGKNYGRLKIALEANCQPPPCYFNIEAYLNPSGSRNLEYDREKSKTIVAP